jgi:competence protein ComEC
MNKKIVSVLTILVFLNIVSWFVVFQFSQNYLEVIFLDVGQGDAILIKTPFDHQILIDGGPSRETIIRRLSEEMPFYDKTIDLIVLTHVDKDHITGLLQALKDYEIENIIWSGIGENKEWEDLIGKEGASIIEAKKGMNILANNISFNVLNPEGTNYSDLNDSSVVLKMNYDSASFLFTGDISSKIDINEDIDVLKVSHHGSKYGTSQELLEKTTPELAIIQVGKNSYGHPSQEVLTRLDNFGIKTLRTDINGSIKIISDGKKLKIISK